MIETFGLYGTSEIKNLFGDAWCGPDALTQWQEECVAKYKENKEDDGQGVEVYCIAAPAKFFVVKAIPGTNSIGRHQDGFTISTGTGCEQWVAATAKLINSGMIGVTVNE